MKTTPLALLALIASTAFATANDYRGLWVGQATLGRVNEVTVPLDENNNSIAPDSAVPTQTADAAHIRLIIHVDANTNACLLKDVAILRRTDDEDEITDNDLVLVSDQREYPSYPQQEAVRIASAVFDFGDYAATKAVDALVKEISEQVGACVDQSGLPSTADEDATTAAVTAAETAAKQGVANRALLRWADIAKEFDTFMGLVFEDLEDIKAGNTPTNVVNIAEALANSAYADPRGTNLLSQIEGNTNDAEWIAWRFADTENDYLRTITGGDFAAMVAEAADTAGAAATNENATIGGISTTVHSLQTVIDAKAWETGIHDDDSIYEAVVAVVDAIVDTAGTYTNRGELASTIATEAEAAAWNRHATLPRFTPSSSIPTADYTEFVTSEEFLNCVEGAAEAAAVAAVSAKKNDSFIDEGGLADVAELAAREHLLSVYIAAANARRTELPMEGFFGPGNGNTNWAVAVTDPDGLKCTIKLPASHPTNPFRHPKHPDHVRGIDITRRIRLDFTGELGASPDYTATGSEALTGVYREEIFGLHKKLGPNSDIGLRVEGTFELNRVSHIDTLNAK